MKGLVKFKKGIGNMEIGDMPMSVPEYNDALIEVKTCGICDTDIKIFKDEFIYNPPVNMGHECSGSIVKLGKGVQDGVLEKEWYSNNM